MLRTALTAEERGTLWSGEGKCVLSVGRERKPESLKPATMSYKALVTGKPLAAVYARGGVARCVSGNKILNGMDESRDVWPTSF
jgi:hypothetical protein